MIGWVLPRSVDDEGFHIRIIFKDGMIARGNSCRIFDRAAELKTNVVIALSANREPLSFQQCGLMHQTVRVVQNSINSAFRHHISRLIFLSHGSSLTGFDSPLSEPL